MVTIEDAKRPIEYDGHRRMKYHPDFHPNYKQPYSVEELEYLCKYWECEHQQSMAFALGRPEASVVSKVMELKKAGLYDMYKHLNYYY